MEFVKLNNGVKMPKLGYGVFQIDGKQCEQCVLNALEVGYRLIDTVQAYYNEEFVGNAIKQSQITRSEIFITTKVWVSEHNYEKAKKSIEKSMEKLQVDYVDLVLIHQALGDYYSAYRAMIDLYKEGKIKAIGISNFSSERMADLTQFNEVVPAVNQVETHPFFQQHELNSWMKKLNIQHEAWGPLAQHRIKEIINNEIFKKCAKKYGKTETQIALRWLMQRDIVAIPKTANKERMKENFDIFDFSLDKAEMEQIRSLDENKSMWLEYNDPNIVEMAMS